MRTFTIHARDAEEVRKLLEKMGKKADKYGVRFGYEFGEPYAKEIAVYSVDLSGGPVERHKVGTYHVEAVDVDVDCDGLIRANGWRVVSRIEHGENGNIVTGFGDEEIDPAWYEAEPRCDHCGTNRFRAVTFMVKNEGGELRQVGKTCLREYTGIDPATAALWASLGDCFDEPRDCDIGEWKAGGFTRMYNVETALAFAVDDIAKHGYRKSDDGADSTRYAVKMLLVGDGFPSEEGKAKAAEIVAWLKELGEIAKKRPGEVGNIERDCVPLALSGFCKEAHLGRLAYMPVAFKKDLERRERDAARNADHESAVKNSEFVGGIGERLTVATKKAELVTSWETQFGWTSLYKFVDNDGNVFVWYASREINVADGMKIVGTVKDHKEYNGVKQTVLTRCKAA